MLFKQSIDAGLNAVNAGLGAIGAGIEWLERRPLRIVFVYAAAVNACIIVISLISPGTQ